ncbi:MAG: serine protease, partial [Alcanivorax sp.]|nr:serine protease [Alcanivorax sp.]
MNRFNTVLTLLLAGIASLASAYTASPRIVGGQTAPDSRWPWMTEVTVLDPANTNQFELCGGSQISPRWIVTAAHCLRRQDGSDAAPSDVHVFIGDSSYHNDVNNGIPAQAILIHPSYNQPAVNGENHDLALIQIASHSQTLWPSLADDNQLNTLETGDMAQLDEAVTALGWGDDASGNVASTLQEVQLDYVPRTRCQMLSPFTINQYMVCAAELNPTATQTDGQDTCFGDSGGPLFIGRDRAPWLVGLTSFGASKCASGTPGVYTNVNAEIGTLEQMTRGANIPLVDLALQASAARAYQPIGGTLSVSAKLLNSSQSSTVNNPTLTISATPTGASA